MSGFGVIRIWQGTQRRGRCRDCRKAILWAQREDDKSKHVRLQLQATAIRIDVHPETHLKTAVYDVADLHVKHCTTPKPRAPRTKRTASPQQRSLL